MFDHYVALLRLIVPIGFHTVASAIDGLLTEDDYPMAYHPANETWVRPKYMHNINIYPIHFSTTILTIILRGVFSSLLSSHCLYPEVGREADGLVWMGLRLYNILE